MNTPLRAALLTSFVFFLTAIPLTASAAVGFTFFDSQKNLGTNNGHDVLTYLVSTYSKVKNDLTAGGSDHYGPITSTQLGQDRTNIVGDGNFAQASWNRACADIDASLGGAGNAISTGGNSNQPVANSDNYNLVWCTNATGVCSHALSIPSWIYEAADGAKPAPSGTSGYTSWLKCDTFMTPLNTLSVDKTNITLGDSATLTWNDNVARDKLLWPSSKTISGCGPTAAPQDEPITACSVSQSSGNDFALTGHDVQVIYYAQDTQTEPCYQKLPYGHYFADDKTGSLKVSPQVTTTYTYTCTNPNGTTKAQVTVNVASAKAPDLNPGSMTVTPGSLSTADTATLSGVVSNTGTDGTHSTIIPELFEIYKGNTMPDNTLLFTSLNDTKQVTDTSIGQGGSANDSSPNYSFASGGTWWVRLCANTSKSSGATPAGSYDGVAESNYNNNCSGWKQVTVTSPMPDLTAEAASVSPAPTTAAPVTLSGKIDNTGGDGTHSTTIPELFEMYKGTKPDQNLQFGSINDTKQVTDTSISKGASVTDTFGNYTFASAGTWWVRLCANVGKSNGGAPAGSYDGVAEYDYTNNCGDWTKEVVTTPGVPTISSCSASPNPVEINTSTTWSASVSGGTAPYSYSWTGSRTSSSASFSATYTGAGTKSESLAITDAHNVPASASCTDLTVTTTPPPAGSCPDAAEVSLTASPGLLPIDNTGATLDWTATNASECSIKGPGYEYDFVPSPVCGGDSGDNSSNPTPQITGPTTFTLDCDNGTATSSVAATVKLIPTFHEF